MSVFEAVLRVSRSVWSAPYPDAFPFVASINKFKSPADPKRRKTAHSKRFARSAAALPPRPFSVLVHRYAMLWATVFFLGLSFSVQAPAAESLSDLSSFPAPKRITIPKLQGPIKIDGELNEPAWNKAASLAPFFKNKSGESEREHTELRLWYDEDALYLGWICQDMDIQATFTNRDSKFWEEEVVECFITSKDLTRYFELQWNPLGGVFDAIITNQLNAKGISKNFDGDWSYTAKGMKSAVKLIGTVNNSDKKDELWQVEVRLPFVDLGQTCPKPQEVWRANFYRFNRTRNQPVEDLSWSPTRLPSFHEPNRFGYIEFGYVSR
jgi:hypothetical protein